MKTYKLVSTSGESAGTFRALTPTEAFDLLVPIYGEEHAKSGMKSLMDGTARCMSVKDAMIECHDMQASANG